MSRKKQIEEAANKLNYDKELGRLFNKNTGNAYLKTDAHGYIRVAIVGRKWKAHRIIWFLEYGTLPDVIDHIDGDRTNNHISNLREASFKQNSYNCTKKTTCSKYKGVTKAKTGRFRACITIDRKKHHLGYFRTEDEAAIAYNEALAKADPSARGNVIQTNPPAPSASDERDANVYATDARAAGWTDSGSMWANVRNAFLAGRNGMVPAAEVENLVKLHRLKDLDANAFIPSQVHVALVSEAVRQERERIVKLIDAHELPYDGWEAYVRGEILNPSEDGK